MAQGPHVVAQGPHVLAQGPHVLAQVPDAVPADAADAVNTRVVLPA